MQKKRSGPEPVDPVSNAGIRYEVVHWGKGRGLEQNGGYVAAIDEASGNELWLLRVYEVNYDSDMEDDKLDVFITRLSLSPAEQRLVVENEHGERYNVDLRNRQVSGA
jgi:hypothetical protein